MAMSDASKYPAFVWCRSKGLDWYLPAINELERLLLNNEVHDAVNGTLNQKGVTPLCEQGKWGLYWSSTERDEVCVWHVNMHRCFTSFVYKDFDYYVRAVAAF
jgi:hypothetical protein